MGEASAFVFEGCAPTSGGTKGEGFSPLPLGRGSGHGAGGRKHGRFAGLTAKAVFPDERQRLRACPLARSATYRKSGTGQGRWAADPGRSFRMRTGDAGSPSSDTGYNTTDLPAALRVMSAPLLEQLSVST
ncbi:hypothetical protein FNA46_08570 [Rhizobium straminoryzae]|uniref:Uncharacterized protein n=1 Tax=Rhizobium straminoryzae TaxID=1387186 RepID=A0A549TCG4_9HYPH|nr:hypothetical protein FNA46_08570 [Rhizobium straminoryzae]